MAFNTDELPDHVQSLHKKRFELFGRYFIATKIINAWEVFDWTSSLGRFKVGTPIVAFPGTLGESIASDELYRTYHIFRFLGWRQ